MFVELELNSKTEKKDRACKFIEYTRFHTKRSLMVRSASDNRLKAKERKGQKATKMMMDAGLGGKNPYHQL